MSGIVSWFKVSAVAYFVTSVRYGLLVVFVIGKSQFLTQGVLRKGKCIYLISG